MRRLVTVASCTVNLWAMDFKGNMEKILESIQQAKDKGAKLRLGTELEISGYSCFDHFLENDTYLHSLEVLAEIIKHPIAQDILIFLGIKILLIRPKLHMCDDRNYSETRYFTPWKKIRQVEDYYLTSQLEEITGQKTVPIGDAVIKTLDTCIGMEICEELWTAESPQPWMVMDGVEIILNASCAHHEFRSSIKRVIALIKTGMEKLGGVYVYTNQRGCDGDRLYFDGEALICTNGAIVAQTKQFDLADVDVITATIDLDDVAAYRIQMRSSRNRSSSAEAYPRVHVDYALKNERCYLTTKEIQPHYNTPAEEIGLGPACFLWDFLRRSDQSGYFLRLDGDLGGAAVAGIISTMCHMICEAVEKGDEIVLGDIRKITGENTYTPDNHKELCNRLLVTCYMATDQKVVTDKEASELLAKEIGSHHLSLTYDSVISAVANVFQTATGFVLKKQDSREATTLRSLKSRLKMVLAYYFAQLTQLTRGRRTGLLVLGSSNLDTSLTGSLVKYGCSYADINPIGAVGKVDLSQLVEYFSQKYGYQSLKTILENDKKAEIETISKSPPELDFKQGLGLTYQELSVMGRLRKPGQCGPFSMFCKLVDLWNDRCTPQEVAKKVKHFFQLYAANRHKLTVLTPAYHADMCSADDGRHDHRQFLFNVQWPWQFNRIDEEMTDIPL